MLVIYHSRTGNVKKFIDKTGLNALPMNQVDKVEEPFVLVTFTDKFGEVPKPVADFLELHHEYLRGISSSGNRNWGSHLFGKCADTISQKYGVPIISKFEMQGLKGDVETFIEGVLNL